MVCVTPCATLQCITDAAAPVGTTDAKLFSVAFGLRPRLPRAVRVLFPNMGLVRSEFVDRVCVGAARVFALLLLVIMILVWCCCCAMVG